MEREVDQEIHRYKAIAMESMQLEHVSDSVVCNSTTLRLSSF
jgi:hypothetical protein